MLIHIKRRAVGWKMMTFQGIAAFGGIERSANSHVDPDQFQPVARA
ncbi:MAG: hypothetical protein WBF73_33490 [Bradyrhizobium sp.]